MLRVRLLDGARQELREATAWYREDDPALASDFAAEIKRGVTYARRFPTAGPVIAEGHGLAARRFLLKRFPYALITTELDKELVVVAISHQSRRPGYWLGRLAHVRR